MDPLLVKPMHNAKQGTCLHLGDLARLTMDLEAIVRVKVDRQGLRGKCKVAQRMV